MSKQRRQKAPLSKKPRQPRYQTTEEQDVLVKHISGEQNILNLQGTIGNHAVHNLLTQSKIDAKKHGGLSTLQRQQPLIQRFWGDEEEDDGGSWVDDAWDTVTDTAGDVADTVTDTASDTWDTVTDTAGDVADTVSDTASDTWDTVTDTASDVADTVTDTASDTWDTVTDTAGDVADTVTDTASDTWDTVTDTASDTWDTVTDTASDTWDTVTDTASDTWDTVTDTASDTWDTVTDTASDIGDWVDENVNLPDNETLTAMIKAEMVTQTNQQVAAAQQGIIPELNDLENYWEDNGVPSEAPTYSGLTPEQLKTRITEQELLIAGLESNRIAIVKKARADARARLQNAADDGLEKMASAGVITGIITGIVTKSGGVALISALVAALIAEYVNLSKARNDTKAILEKAKEDLKVINTNIKIEKKKLEAMKKAGPPVVKVEDLPPAQQPPVVNIEDLPPAQQ